MFRHVVGRYCFRWGAGKCHFNQKEKRFFDSTLEPSIQCISSNRETLTGGIAAIQSTLGFKIHFVWAQVLMIRVLFHKPVFI